MRHRRLLSALSLAVGLSAGVGVAPLAADPLACGRPVCAVPPHSLPLLNEITFNDQPSGLGPGRQIDGILEMPGAGFGERFDGQVLTTATAYDAPFDAVTGTAFPGLALRPGVAGQNLSILRLPGTNVLSGDGPAGVPRQQATGEGAIAIRLAQPQAGLRLTLRGGEGGMLTVLFLGLGGNLIDSHRIAPLGEGALDFVRAGGIEDISGVVLSNLDPEGIALETLAFGLGRQVSLRKR